MRLSSVWSAAWPAVLGVSLAACVGAAERLSAAPRPRRAPAALVAPDRLEALSRAYIGTPYRLDCLGEARGPDADPLFTRAAVDCQTLVEQVMAEALAPWCGGLDPAVRLVRYHGSVVSLENRYHYCDPDWLTNPWPARDITLRIGQAAVRRTTRTIDRPALLARRGGARHASPTPAQVVRTVYIPRSRVREVEPRVPHGSIALFVLNQPDIVAGHVGFLFRRDGRLLLRHASQVKHRVIDEPLAQYLARAPKRFVGLKVLQPDPAGLERPAGRAGPGAVRRPGGGGEPRRDEGGGAKGIRPAETATSRSPANAGSARPASRWRE